MIELSYNYAYVVKHTDKQVDSQKQNTDTDMRKQRDRQDTDAEVHRDIQTDNRL